MDCGNGETGVKRWNLRVNGTKKLVQKGGNLRVNGTKKTGVKKMENTGYRNGKPMEQDLSEGYPEPPVLTIVISAKRAVQPISEKEE